MQVSGWASQRRNGGLLEELFVRYAVFIVVCSRLPGEQRRELFVEVNEVLCVFASLKLVLRNRLMHIELCITSRRV